jgi:hypothetical protein
MWRSKLVCREQSMQSQIPPALYLPPSGSRLRSIYFSSSSFAYFTVHSLAFFSHSFFRSLYTSAIRGSTASSGCGFRISSLANSSTALIRLLGFHSSGRKRPMHMLPDVWVAEGSVGGLLLALREALVLDLVETTGVGGGATAAGLRVGVWPSWVTLGW